MENDQPEQKTTKWTKEFMRAYQREYMRERWRRVHGVKPENYTLGKKTANQVKAEELGGAALALLEFQKEQQRERYLVPKTTCKFCCEEYYDNEPGLKRHERNRRHKLAVELYDKLRSQLIEEKNSMAEKTEV